MRHLCDRLHPFWTSNTDLKTKSSMETVSKAIKTSSPLILEQEVWPHIYLVQRYLRAHASQQVTPEDPARGKPCWGIQLVQPGGYSKWWLSLFPFDSLFFCLCCLSRSNLKSTKKRATQNKTGTLSHTYLRSSFFKIHRSATRATSASSEFGAEQI